jgi:hypothetical protein
LEPFIRAESFQLLGNPAWPRGERQNMRKTEMSNADFDALKKQFDDFSRRLEARRGEFKDKGLFATTHAAYAEKLVKGQASVEARLAAAARRGDIWEATKAELSRDINALIGDFGHLAEALDAEIMK